MKLLIKILNEKARNYYQAHKHFHIGDAGLDLYIIEDINFSPGETKAIKLGIACEPKDGKSYYLMPRSSISKTPLRMSNMVGIIDFDYRVLVLLVLVLVLVLMYLLLLVLLLVLLVRVFS